VLALISDIHSNASALEAVLADIKEQGAERIYCLGDVIGYGARPRECLDLAADLDLCLMGNHDHAVLLEPGGFNTAAEQAVFWTREALDVAGDAAQRRRRWEFLATLDVHKFEDNLLFVHGSPRRPLHEYVFPDDPEVNMQKMVTIFERFPVACFVGHTHMPGMFTEDFRFVAPSELDHTVTVGERKAVINIGSVGQPRDRDPRACYVLLEGRRVTWRRVAYDVDAAVQDVLGASGLDEFNAHRLRDGR
jgi:diadenosine tetraphosphatase ApaH/serine/threonine PP2A family protein phosphatase